MARISTTAGKQERASEEVVIVDRRAEERYRGPRPLKLYASTPGGFG